MSKRTKRVEDPARVDREADSRMIENNREVVEDERIELFRSQFVHEVLPDLPEIPGYHTCWLTTTNPRDSIHMRMRLGYEPIRANDIPGYEFFSLKTGEYAGLVGVNEMIAFKLPLFLYENYMNEAHVVRPHQEMQKITSVLDDLQAQAQMTGGRVEEDEGFAEMRKTPKTPSWN